MSTQTYKIQEAKTHLSCLLQEVAAGTEVIITKEGKPMARISRIEEGRPKIRCQTYAPYPLSSAPSG